MANFLSMASKLGNAAGKASDMASSAGNIVGNMANSAKNSAGAMASNVAGKIGDSKTFKTVTMSKTRQHNKDMKCIKNAFGEIIFENKGTVKTKLDAFINDTFKDITTNDSFKQDLINTIKDTIFFQLKESILEDFHVIHTLVYTMFTNNDDYSYMGTMLLNSFQGSKYESTYANTNSVFNKFMEELKKETIPGNMIGGGGLLGAVSGVAGAVSGATGAVNALSGATEEEDQSSPPTESAEGSTPSMSLEEQDNCDKVGNWFKPDIDERKINYDILYIIKNLISDILNEDANKKTIYKTITKPIENNITNILLQLNGKENFVLKKYILYKLLNGDGGSNILRKTFKSAITDVLKKANLNQLNNPNYIINSAFIKTAFVERFKNTLFIDPKKGGKKKTIKNKRSNKKKITHKKKKYSNINSK